MATALRPQVTPPAYDRRALWTLLGGNVLLELGVGFFFPVLPIFLSRRGADSALVGAVVASGVLAKAIAQYPAGRLADRLGRRPVLIASLGLYTACFLGYLLPLPVAAFLGVRFVQALMIGAYLPAAGAAVADLTPPGGRGQAYGRLRATEMIGLLLGPVLGGLVAGLNLEAVFAAAAALCTVACALLLRLPRTGRPAPGAIRPPAPGWALVRRLAPVLLIGGAIYYTIGTYDAIWSLYMVSRGASTWQVGLSFAVYALPVGLVAGLFGGWSDRLGLVRAGALALLGYAVFNGLYPLLTDPWLLIGAGLAEGGASALAAPAMSAEVSRQAPPGAQGSTQGIVNVFSNVALGLGALAGGPLFGIGPGPAFWTSAVICAAALAVLLVRPITRRGALA